MQPDAGFFLGPHHLAPLRPGMPVLALAPMAGVGNWVFRLICARLGARVVGVEFINCRVISEKSRRTDRLLDFSDAAIYDDTGLSLLAAQIYGNDIGLIAAGAAEMEHRGAHIVDINFGCSVPQILRKGCGAAYLKDLDLLFRAVKETVDAVTVPVMVKTRIGWDADSINILEVVQRVEDAGAKAIAIHARTVVQKYKGKADWDWIARAKERASIPLFGNGDICCYEDAIAMTRHTSCDGVMIGRAAMANPWIFSGRNGATMSERLELASEQLRLMGRYKGDRVGVLETRKHLALYFKELSRDSERRRELLTTSSLSDILEFLDRWRTDEAGNGEEADLALSAADADHLAWGGTS
jgi:tRNA-dihydrouridine synthase B